MITVEADFSALARRTDEMLAKLDHFKRVDIGAELSAWQTDDLHRNRPFTMRSRARGQAKTVIRPHSRIEVERSAAAQAGFGKLQKQLAKPRKRAYRGKFYKFRFWRHWSTRPILRVEMFETLSRRMSDLLHEKISWK